jgi:hypothetical protein
MLVIVSGTTLPSLSEITITFLNPDANFLMLFNAYSAHTKSAW